MTQAPPSASRTQLYTLISVFFFWGFVAAGNSILIPIFKKNFDLSQFQSQLVDLAFYAAYFVGSLIYFLVSQFSGDPLNRIGYKQGIVIGLLISAVGTLGFVAAAAFGSYPLLLLSLFVVGLGFALQQIAAQPFVIALGPPDTGAHRLNLAGGINSFGTTIGPVLISYALFGALAQQTGAGQAEAVIALDAVMAPYVVLSLSFVAFAGFFAVSALPRITNDEAIERGAGALRFPQLVLGMAAIFTYVGVEVSIQSNMPALLALPEFGGYASSNVSQFISLYWGSLMIGRWTGAISAFNFSRQVRLALTVVVPFVAFGVILGVNTLRGSDMRELYAYALCVAGMVVAFVAGEEKPAQTLLIFAGLGVAAMAVGLLTTGQVALYAFLCGGLCCSVMWPCIFSLAIAGLGKYTNQGSSFLIMMILGGAIVPPLQGLLCDAGYTHGSYAIPLAGFGYLAFFAWQVRRVLQQQGLNPDDTAPLAGH